MRACDAVIQAITDGVTNIKLNAYAEQWEDTDMIELGTCLKMNTSVTSLQIYDVRVVFHLWQMLGDVLSFNSSLTVIDISNSNIDQDCAHLVTNALITDNRTLEKLSVTGFSDSDCSMFVQNIADVLVCNPTLTYLKLNVEVDTTGQLFGPVWKLLGAMCANTHIVYFGLGEMEWNNNVKLHVLEIINHSTSLCQLALIFPDAFASRINDDMCNELLTPSSLQHVWIHGIYWKRVMNMHAVPCSVIVMIHDL